MTSALVAERVTVDLVVGLPAALVGALAGCVVATIDDGAFLSAASLVGRAVALVDVWLTMPDATCCAMQVGLEVGVDGRSWTGFTLDHFWHLEGWFMSLAQLARDGPGATASTFVWDESSLAIERDDPWLRMQDARWNKLDDAEARLAVIRQQLELCSIESSLPAFM